MRRLLCLLLIAGLFDLPGHVFSGATVEVGPQYLDLPDGFYDYWKHVWLEDRSRLWFHTLTVRINIRRGELKELSREFKARNMIDRRAT